MFIAFILLINNSLSGEEHLDNFKFSIDNVFSMSSALRDMSVQGRHVCLKCGKVYKYKRGLWTHQKFECDKKPQFHCDFCKKSYTRKETLIVHQRMVHTFKNNILM